MVVPPSLIAATPVGARTTKRLSVVPVIYLRKVVLPVPAFPVRKIDRPVSLTYLSAVSNTMSFSTISSCLQFGAQGTDFFCDLTACQPLIHIYYCIRCAAKSSKMPVSSTISTKGVQLCSWSMARRPTHAIIHPSSLRREELKFAPTLITDRPSCCHGRA